MLYTPSVFSLKSCFTDQRNPDFSWWEANWHLGQTAPLLMQLRADSTHSKKATESGSSLCNLLRRPGSPQKHQRCMKAVLITGHQHPLHQTRTCGLRFSCIPMTSTSHLFPHTIPRTGPLVRQIHTVPIMAPTISSLATHIPSWLPCTTFALSSHKACLQPMYVTSLQSSLVSPPHPYRQNAGPNHKTKAITNQPH